MGPSVCGAGLSLPSAEAKPPFSCAAHRLGQSWPRCQRSNRVALARAPSKGTPGADIERPTANGDQGTADGLWFRSNTAWERHVAGVLHAFGIRSQKQYGLVPVPCAFPNSRQAQNVWQIENYVGLLNNSRENECPAFSSIILYQFADNSLWLNDLYWFKIC